MTKQQDMKKLITRISTCSGLSKEERKRILDDIKNGQFYDFHSGYPSIDRPWLKYYTEDDLKLKIPQVSIDEYFEMRTQEFNNLVALEFYGKRITFKQFKKNRDKAYNALISFGLKPGDIISICLPNIPETGYLFYAAMKLGLIANMLDPRTNASTLVSNVNSSGSKFLVSLDAVIAKFLDTKVDTIISVSPINSLPSLLQNGIKLSNKSLNVSLPDDKRIISYNNMIKKGKDNTKSISYKHKPNSPAVIAYTGGSTGVPKGVVVSHEAFNAMMIENSLMDYHMYPKSRALNMAPPWTYYGLSNCYNAYLHLGVESILIPAFGPDDLGKFIKKYKPNHIITVPSALTAVIKEKGLGNINFLKTIIVGADKLDTTFELEFDEFLKKHHSDAKVTKGYGMTEVTAAAAYTKGETNVPGTVGIPYIFETISIFDVEDYNLEKKYGERGEIAICGPKNMIGYYGLTEETKDITKKHKDGELWIHTGDIGHMDEDGKLFIDGRIKRMFTKSGFKIFPAEIEAQILKFDNILQAAVIGIENESTAFNVKAFVVLKNSSLEEKEEFIKDLKEFLTQNLYDYEIPDEIEIIDHLPLTLMNKIDYSALMEMEKEINTK